MFLMTDDLFDEEFAKKIKDIKYTITARPPYFYPVVPQNNFQSKELSPNSCLSNKREPL